MDQRVMAAIQPGEDVAASELITRMVDQGSTRTAAHNLVSRAVKRGLVFRLGEPREFSYRLNQAYEAPVQRHIGRYLTVLEPKPVVEAYRPPSPGTAYVGPVFDREPLLPHLGTPCGDDDELPPALGERYRDTTRRIFERAFTTVE